MQAYRYETVILKDGILKVPQLKALENHRVEIIVIDEEKNHLTLPEKKVTMENFLEKWSGFLDQALEDRRGDKVHSILYKGGNTSRERKDYEKTCITLAALRAAALHLRPKRSDDCRQ